MRQFLNRKMIRMIIAIFVVMLIFNFVFTCNKVFGTYGAANEDPNRDNSSDITQAGEYTVSLQRAILLGLYKKDELLQEISLKYYGVNYDSSYENMKTVEFAYMKYANDIEKASVTYTVVGAGQTQSITDKKVNLNLNVDEINGTYEKFKIVTTGLEGRRRI